MQILTTGFVPGKEIEALGAVSGTVVQSKHLGRDIAASLKSVVGGEVRGYTEMLNEAHEICTQRLSDEARKLGADAVVGLRFTLCCWPDGSTGLLAYGTAAKIKS